MTVQQAIVTLVAAIISGVLATIITLVVNAKSEKKRIKRELVDDLFGFRYQLGMRESQSAVQGKLEIDIYAFGLKRALNRVPIVFSENEDVLSKYDIWYNALQIADTSEREKKANETYVDLIKAICNDVGIECSNWNDSKIMSVIQ